MLVQGKPDNIWGTRLSQASLPSISSLRPHNQSSSTNLFRVHMRRSNYHETKKPSWGWFHCKQIYPRWYVFLHCIVFLMALIHMRLADLEDERSLMINAFMELPSEEMLQIARSFKWGWFCGFNEASLLISFGDNFIMIRFQEGLCSTLLTIPHSPRLNSTEVEKWSGELRSRPNRYSSFQKTLRYSCT